MPSHVKPPTHQKNTKVGLFISFGTGKGTTGSAARNAFFGFVCVDHCHDGTHNCGAPNGDVLGTKKMKAKCEGVFFNKSER